MSTLNVNGEGVSAILSYYHYWIPGQISTGSPRSPNINGTAVVDCVIGDPNGVINSKGICWSTAHNPTINDSKTQDGSGPNNWSGTMSGLSWGVTYYVRAYAINGDLVGYGNETAITFGDDLT